MMNGKALSVGKLQVLRQAVDFVMNQIAHKVNMCFVLFSLLLNTFCLLEIKVKSTILNWLYLTKPNHSKS